MSDNTKPIQYGQQDSHWLMIRRVEAVEAHLRVLSDKVSRAEERGQSLDEIKRHVEILRNQVSELKLTVKNNSTIIDAVKYLAAIILGTVVTIAVTAFLTNGT